MGDSVAINGCCLTVVELSSGIAAFDLLAQTLRVTSLGELAAGSCVNLERAMMVGSGCRTKKFKERRNVFAVRMR